jgi:ATP-binding protein involved in chromosome partitioning
MGADSTAVESAVGAVVDPELDLPIGSLGMVREVRSRRRRVGVSLALPLGGWPGTDDLAARVRAAAEGVSGVEEASVEIGIMDDDERAALRSELRSVMEGTPDASSDAAPSDEPSAPQAAGNGGHSHAGHSHGAPAESPTPALLRPGAHTRVVGISSGKGGVGKSSVTVNLALALAAAGKGVGVLDADVYGFSVPGMIGAEHEPIILGDLVVPTLAHGVRCLSMGFFVPDDQPVIWRGPMLHKAIQQLLFDAYWGEPDFLLIDMPPGTGDVTLSLAEVAPRAEVVVVTTPQPAAQRVAQRSAFAARKLKLPVRGVIENMSWFTGDDGVRYELFGRGGGQALAADLGVPLLGQLPLVPELREGGDTGKPIVAVDPESEASTAFASLAERLVSMGPGRVYRRELAIR